MVIRAGDGRPRSKDGEASLQEETGQRKKVGSRREKKNFFSCG